MAGSGSPETGLWPLGMLIYILGTIGESLGANLQRKSILRERALKDVDQTYEERTKFQQTTWKVGFFMFVGAGIAMSLALFFASQTLLAPLQLFLFISNVVFANLINREPFAWLGKDGLATAFVITGVAMCVVSAPKATHDLTDEQMIELMQMPGFISFCVCAFLLICFLFVSKRRILAACGGDPRTIPQRWKRTYLNMSYGALAGAFGGVNVTLTKTTFSLIEGEFRSGGFLGMISSPLLWGVALTLICTYVGQMWVTVNGLGVASAIIVISSHSVTEEVVATLGGILYFEDYEKFEAWSWTVFAFGNIIAICSVVYLSHLRLSVAEKEERESSHVTSSDIAFERDDDDTGKESDSLVSPVPSPIKKKKEKRTPFSSTADGSTTGSATTTFAPARRITEEERPVSIKGLEMSIV